MAIIIDFMEWVQSRASAADVKEGPKGDTDEAAFELVRMHNKRKKERLEKERLNGNKSVISSYNLKPKGKTP